MGSNEVYDLYQRGKAHLERGDNAQATVSLEKAKRREPDKASIREALGVAYLRMRRYQEAAAYFEQLQNRSTATTGPRLITKIQPLQAGDFQGNVLLTMTVDTEGRVADAQIPRGINATVDAKALEAVKTWRFQPASRNGQPITAFIVVEVPFRR